MGILQAGTLEWVTMPFSRGSSQPWGSNSGLPHYRWILYHLSHQGSPRILEWGAYCFARGTSRPRNWTRISCTGGGFFTSWATREAQDTFFIGVSLVNAYKYACVSKWTEVHDKCPPRKRISGVLEFTCTSSWELINLTDKFSGILWATWYHTGIWKLAMLETMYTVEISKWDNQGICLCVFYGFFLPRKPVVKKLPAPTFGTPILRSDVYTCQDQPNNKSTQGSGATEE